MSSKNAPLHHFGKTTSPDNIHKTTQFECPQKAGTSSHPNLANIANSSVISESDIPLLVIRGGSLKKFSHPSASQTQSNRVDPNQASIALPLISQEYPKQFQAFTGHRNITFHFVSTEGTNLFNFSSQ